MSVSAPALISKPPVGPSLFIARGIRIRGALLHADTLTIEGGFETEGLSVRELIVAPFGLFSGEAAVGIADVAGILNGDVFARECLIVRATGVVAGRVRCGRLRVEEGGQIIGQIEMANHRFGTSSENSDGKVFKAHLHMDERSSHANVSGETYA